MLAAIILLLSSCGARKRGEASYSKADKALIAKYQPMLGADFNLQNLPLLKEVDKWLGTAYKYGASNPEGTDCSGFVSSVYANVYGVSLPRSSYEQYAACSKVTMENLQPSDLVFFKLDHSGKISHVGIYLGNSCFAHATLSKGVMIDHLTDNYYRKGFISGGRVIRKDKG